MTYEETIELEQNVKLKNEAEDIYNKFLENIVLSPKDYKGEGKFLHWADSHNKIYIKLENDTFILQCRFLHKSYNVTITPSAIFKYLKEDYRGIRHLRSLVRDK